MQVLIYIVQTHTHARTHSCTGNQFVIRQAGSVVGDPWPSHCLALQPLLLLPGHHPIISLHSCLICALVIEYRVGSLVHLIIEYNLLLQSCCCSRLVAHQCYDTLSLSQYNYTTLLADWMCIKTSAGFVTLSFLSDEDSGLG